MPLSVDTHAFTPIISGSLWKAGCMPQLEGRLLREAAAVWAKATPAQVLATKTGLVGRVFGDYSPAFADTFVGCPFEDYIFMQLRDAIEDEYALGVWHGDEVTVYYARFPECVMHGAPGGIRGKGIKSFQRVEEFLLCCSFRSG